MSARKSVSRSATMIGADFAIGVPWTWRRRYALSSSPIFPGVITMTSPEKNTARLSRAGTEIARRRR